MNNMLLHTRTGRETRDEKVLCLEISGSRKLSNRPKILISRSLFAFVAVVLGMVMITVMGCPICKTRRFRELFLSGFKAVQRHLREIEALIWPMFPASDTRMATQVINNVM